MERWSVATSEILFRVFLFHFEKISGVAIEGSRVELVKNKLILC